MDLKLLLEHRGGVCLALGRVEEALRLLDELPAVGNSRCHLREGVVTVSRRHARAQNVPSCGNRL